MLSSASLRQGVSTQMPSVEKASLSAASHRYPWRRFIIAVFFAIIPSIVFSSMLIPALHDDLPDARSSQTLSPSIAQRWLSHLGIDTSASLDVRYFSSTCNSSIEDTDLRPPKKCLPFPPAVTRELHGISDRIQHDLRWFRHRNPPALFCSVSIPCAHVEEAVVRKPDVRSMTLDAEKKSRGFLIDRWLSAKGENEPLPCFVSYASFQGRPLNITEARKATKYAPGYIDAVVSGLRRIPPEVVVERGERDTIFEPYIFKYLRPRTTCVYLHEMDEMAASPQVHVVLSRNPELIILGPSIVTSAFRFRLGRPNSPNATVSRFTDWLRDVQEELPKNHDVEATTALAQSIGFGLLSPPPTVSPAQYRLFISRESVPGRMGHPRLFAAPDYHHMVELLITNETSYDHDWSAAMRRLSDIHLPTREEVVTQSASSEVALRPPTLYFRGATTGRGLTYAMVELWDTSDEHFGPLFRTLHPSHVPDVPIGSVVRDLSRRNGRTSPNIAKKVGLGREFQDSDRCRLVAALQCRGELTMSSTLAHEIEVMWPKVVSQSPSRAQFAAQLLRHALNLSLRTCAEQDQIPTDRGAAFPDTLPGLSNMTATSQGSNTCAFSLTTPHGKLYSRLLRLACFFNLELTHSTNTKPIMGVNRSSIPSSPFSAGALDEVRVPVPAFLTDIKFATVVQGAQPVPSLVGPYENAGDRSSLAKMEAPGCEAYYFVLLRVLVRVKAALRGDLSSYAPSNEVTVNRSIAFAHSLSRPRHRDFFFDADGNSNSWDGLRWKLCSGRPTFKVLSSSQYVQWYYGALDNGTNIAFVRPPHAAMDATGQLGSDVDSAMAADIERALRQTTREGWAHIAAGGQDVCRRFFTAAAAHQYVDDLVANVWTTHVPAAAGYDLSSLLGAFVFPENHEPPHSRAAPPPGPEAMCNVLKMYPLSVAQAPSLGEITNAFHNNWLDTGCGRSYAPRNVNTGFSSESYIF